MGKPKLLVPMTYEEFDRLVMNFGCPECHTRVIHHPKCSIGQTWESMKPEERTHDNQD